MAFNSGEASDQKQALQFVSVPQYCRKITAEWRDPLRDPAPFIKQFHQHSEKNATPVPRINSHHPACGAGDPLKKPLLPQGLF